MNKRLFFNILAAILFFSNHALAANIKIENWKTKNGSSVYFVKSTALPMVDISVVFAAGSAYDGAQWGLASYVNAMLGQGTTTQSANAIANNFDRVGASFKVNLDKDMASVSLRTLTDPHYMTGALATYQDVLTHATFDKAAFARIMNQTLASIQVSHELPDALADDVFNKTLYGAQAYGHPTIGTHDRVKALTPSDIQHFYKRYYVASNADIVLVGDVSQQRAAQIAESLSSALPRGEPAPTLTAMHALNAGKTQQINFPSQQTTIVLGQLGITRQSSDYFPLMLGNSILGQLPLTSLLFQNVRNTRGLAYSADSDFNLLQYKGSFQIQLKTRAEKTTEAIDVVRKTLTDFVHNGPSPQEMKIAKDYINGSFPLSTATNNAILNTVINIAFYHRPLNFMDTYLQNVNAITAAQIQQAFARLLDPQKMILVTVGPALHTKREELP